MSLDSFKCRKTLKVGAKTYTYFSLKAAEKNGLKGISKLPYSLKVLLENLLRFEDGRSVTKDDIVGIASWLKNRGKDEKEIAFRPARVLMQDFTGVPAVVDLAAMRDAMKGLGKDPKKINPLAPVDLVIDHSVMVDFFANSKAFKNNVNLEYDRNGERYTFLKWGQGAFDNFRVVPPGTGICHQVNLEYLAKTVWTRDEKVKGKTVTYAYPDTLVGTDSHTTMVNGLAVLGWGVGGIEAEAAMLGQPISMLIPEVIGFRSTARCPRARRPPTSCSPSPRCCARRAWSASSWNSTARASRISRSRTWRRSPTWRRNMAPPAASSRSMPRPSPISRARRAPRQQVALVEKYAKAQDMFWTPKAAEPVFTDTLALDLATVVPSMAGPKRPQDRVELANAATGFAKVMADEFKKAEELGQALQGRECQFRPRPWRRGDRRHHLLHQHLEPQRDDRRRPAGAQCGEGGPHRRSRGSRPRWRPARRSSPNISTRSGLQKDLDKIGFNLVGYGCTTCIGNSGPLPENISEAIRKNDLVAAAVLSGNRNFEGRVNPDVRANYLASPPLVVAYALAGSLNVDLTKDPLGHDKKGKPVYLKDIWPTAKEIAAFVRKNVTRKAFAKRYKDVFKGDAHWRKIKVTKGMNYAWDAEQHLCGEPALFRGPDHDAGAGEGRRGRAHPRPLPRLDHHRPHLARR